MIFDAIKAYWDKQESDRPQGHIGMSALGHCRRQLGYNHHQTPGTPLDWRAKVIFDDGDMHHDQLRKALREGLLITGSCYGLYSEEDEVTLGILKGHIDGMLVHETGNCSNEHHKNMLLEVKSMNDRGFQELKRTKTLSKEYRCQISAYLRACEVAHALVLVKNKNTGDMFTLVYEGEDDLLDERLDVLAKVLESATPEDNPREYQADESGELDWHCNYCPFTMLCWRHEQVVQLAPHKYTLAVQKMLPLTKSVTSCTDPTSGEKDKTIGTEVAIQVTEVKGDKSKRNKKKR